MSEVLTNAHEESCSDMALDAPLEQLHSDEDDSSRIRPLLYRMYIACNVLRLGPETRFSALIFLHRYNMAISHSKNSSKSIEWKWVAAACLFLACKAEEETRRLRDVINLAQMIFSINNKTNEGQQTITLQPDPPNLNEAYWDAKKKIIQTEQIVLRWLGFDTSVSHPHRAVVLLLEHEGSSIRKQVVPIAFRRLNDALFYGPALGHKSLELACAAIELAKLEIDDQRSFASFPDGWWKNYDVSKETMVTTKRDLENATKLLYTLCQTNK